MSEQVSVVEEQPVTVEVITAGLESTISVIPASASSSIIVEQTTQAGAVAVIETAAPATVGFILSQQPATTVVESQTQTPVAVEVFPNVVVPSGPASGDLTDYYPAPSLKPTGVTPGTVLFPQSITVDAKGRITAIQGGSAPSNSDKTYPHLQLSPISTWVINHNLGKFPTIQVFDSAGSQIFGYGRTDDPSLNITTLSFSAAFSGKAYCN